MAVVISFKPGAHQSYAACRYFGELAGDLVSTFIDDMVPRQYLVGNVSAEGFAVRIWSARAMEGPEVLDLATWVRSIAQDLDALVHGSITIPEVRGILERWLAVRHGVSAFFIEVLRPDSAFTTKEELHLSIGVIGGMSMMVSAPNVMFVEQASGLFGLSIAGRGSYLIEQVTERTQAERVSNG